MATFLCFAPEDRRFAHWLARYLGQCGLRVRLVDETIKKPVNAWERAVAFDIRECTQFVLVLTPAALNSWEVHDQALLAKQAGKKIVLLLLQPCQVPDHFSSCSSIDLTGRGPSWQTELRRLVNDLAETDSELTDSLRLKLVALVGMVNSAKPTWLLLLIVFAGLWFFLQWSPLSRAGTGETETVIPITNRNPTPIATLTLPAVPNPEPTPIDTRVRFDDGKVMVLVPGGKFLMGSPETDTKAASDEVPQRPVYVSAFWIDKTEVNNAQYQLCQFEGSCTPPSETRNSFSSEQLPVVGVNWMQAMAYCRWAGGRLPTEAEWEKAARGTDARAYPWGEKFDGSRLNYCDQNCVADWRDFEGNDGYRYTAPVGAFPEGASPYGALNMVGNVWEWTADWYAETAYLVEPNRNPAGPGVGQQRVIRGGSWLYGGRNVRVTRRQKELPTYGYDNIGFRCVVPVESSHQE
jgi:formylglycine-generating enzyme required for sulfatase activity